MASARDDTPEEANTAKEPTPSEDTCTAKVPNTAEREANTNTDASADTHTLREPTDQERKEAPTCAPIMEYSFTGGFGQQEFDYSMLAKPKVHAFDPATEEAKKKKRRERKNKSKSADSVGKS